MSSLNYLLKFKINSGFVTPEFRLWYLSAFTANNKELILTWNWAFRSLELFRLLPSIRAPLIMARFIVLSNFNKGIQCHRRFYSFDGCWAYCFIFKSTFYTFLTKRINIYLSSLAPAILGSNLSSFRQHF